MRFLENSVKSTVDEIRQRFDADVERFSNLETGQSATMDSPLAMELIAQVAAATTPHDGTFSMSAAGPATTRSNSWNKCQMST